MALPQPGQVGWREAPQCVQNLRPSRFSVPHPLQFISPRPGLRHRDRADRTISDLAVPGGLELRIRFFGVRGSSPWSAPANARYGSNTATVSVEADPAVPLLFDLGTGLSRVDAGAGFTTPLSAAALVSHLHLDHVQGLPFFPSVHEPGAHIDIYGPVQDEGSLGDAVGGLIQPPYFPLPLHRFRADIAFHEVLSDDFRLGRARVKARPVPHLGPTVGYRVECDGASVAYVSDHQEPPGQTRVADSVLELCDGVDLLIHDAQYTRQELSRKPDWGHSTVDYAVLVAKEAGARRLCLFHHDPSHTDEVLDGLLDHARGLAGDDLDEVLAASEGMALLL